MGITLHTLTAEHKKALKLSYLGSRRMSDAYFVLELGITAFVLVPYLYGTTVSKTLTLTDSQLSDLVADIEYCKCHGLWDSQEEQGTIDWCRQITEEREMYSKMSNADKKAYDQLRKKAINDFLEKAERERW